MVYAVWAVRREFAEREPDDVRPARLGAQRVARATAREHLDAIAEYAARWEPFPVGVLPQLLRHAAASASSRRYREGLQRYFAEAHAIGQLERVPELRVFGERRVMTRPPAPPTPRRARRSRRPRATLRLTADRGAHAAARRADMLELAAAATRDARPAAPRARGHLHRRPQRQLHQRLRVAAAASAPSTATPADPDAYVLPARRARTPRSPRRSTLDGHRDPAAGRHAPRPAHRVVRGHAARAQGATTRIHVHGFGPPEIVHIAKLSGICHAPRCCARLRDAGLDSLPGGGAEILVDRVRSHVSPQEGDERRSGSTSCARRTSSTSRRPRR